MLFFITMGAHTDRYPLAFKYISCYSLSDFFEKTNATKSHLNTSHVILYLRVQERPENTCCHLNTSHVILYRSRKQMTGTSFPYLNTSHVILYLRILQHRQFIVLHLNTSHVILYRLLPGKGPVQNGYLNTSHVILYRCRENLEGEVPKFKYISCYSLSNRKCLSIYPARNLNTSHVILYRFW